MFANCIFVCPFVLFIVVFALSVLLQFTDSDYTFAILKLFVPTHGYFEYFIHINPSPFQDDKNKAKAKYDMLGHHNAQTNTINVNKTWSRLQTT
jgi:hypothetical protein